MMTASGHRPASFCAVRFVSVSPQNKNRLICGSSELSKFGSRRHISAKDGVETHTEARDAASAGRRRRKSDCCDFVRGYNVPPQARHVYRSMTERSKENGAWFKKMCPSLSFFE